MTELEKQKNALDIDEDDTIDPEDFSHQEEAMAMAQVLKLKLEEAKTS